MCANYDNNVFNRPDRREVSPDRIINSTFVPQSHRGEFDIGMVGHANFAIKIPSKQIETAAHWIFIDGIRE